MQTPSFLERWRFRFDVWLSTRILPFRLRGKAFNEILRDYPDAAAARYPRFPVDFIARTVRKAARNPLLMRDRRCLRTGLVGFDYFYRCGYSPELHFAVDSGSLNADRLSAHCWVTVDGHEVVNRRNSGQVTIYVHRADGEDTEKAAGVSR